MRSWRISVPAGATLTVETVSGEITITEVSGAVELGSVSGSVKFVG